METLSGNRPSPPPPPPTFPISLRKLYELWNTKGRKKKKLESKYTGNFCAYTDNPPNIIKYFSPLHPQDISLETIPCRYKKKNPQKALETPTVRIRACIKKSWNDFSLKKKYASLSGKKSNGRRKFSEKRRKLKASYRKREDPFSLYEENFFLRKRELFKSERRNNRQKDPRGIIHNMLIRSRTTRG